MWARSLMTITWNNMKGLSWILASGSTVLCLHSNTHFFTCCYKPVLGSDGPQCPYYLVDMELINIHAESSIDLCFLHRLSTHKHIIDVTEWHFNSVISSPSLFSWRVPSLPSSNSQLFHSIHHNLTGLSNIARWDWILHILYILTHRPSLLAGLRGPRPSLGPSPENKFRVSDWSDGMIWP